jgi:xylulokinase
LLAAVGDGAYKNIEEACKATIQVVDRVPPRKASQKTYDAGFPMYQSLYQSLRGRFEAIGKMS